MKVGQNERMIPLIVFMLGIVFFWFWTTLLVEQDNYKRLIYTVISSIPMFIFGSQTKRIAKLFGIEFEKEPTK